MSRYFFLTAAVIAVGMATSATAETRFGAGLSTFGPTLEAQTKLTRNSTIRGTWSGGLSLLDDTSADGVDYAVSGALGGTSVTANYHMPAGLRFGAGLFFSNSSLSATADVATGENFGDLVAPEDLSFATDVSFANSLTPMATMGLDMPFFGGLVLSADAGAIWTGGFDVSIEQTTSSAAVTAGHLADAEEALEAEINNYEFVPYLSFMVGKWF